MMPRSWIVFTGILLLGSMVFWVLPLGAANPEYWFVVLALAVIGGLAARAPSRSAPRTGGGWLQKGEFLCDSCKYDHPDLCSRADRPNATRCPDYQQRV